MRRTLKTTKMPSWWRKAVAGLVAGLLLGCAAPPGTVGSQVTSVPVTALVARQGSVPTLAEHRDAPKVGPKADSKPTPDLVPDVSERASVAAPTPWAQRGRASWYGKQFNGRRTASGERFNAMALTAAHRTLPLFSYARVRVVGSGKEVVVRINDRGPFHAARVLDVSYAAARQLGMVGRGSALVDIAPLTGDDVPASVGADGGVAQSAP